jgi:hypothetical protein
MHLAAECNYTIYNATDSALTLLAAAAWDVPSPIGLRADPLLQRLRTDPRGERLLQAIVEPSQL